MGILLLPTAGTRNMIAVKSIRVTLAGISLPMRVQIVLCLTVCLTLLVPVSPLTPLAHSGTVPLPESVVKVVRITVSCC